VSNVLNSPDMVAPPTRARVLQVIADTGFVRSTAAHQLRVGKSRTVGIVLLDIANPFFAEMARGAERVLRDNGYVLMVCSSDESPEMERDYLRVLEEHRVDGLLITPAERSLAQALALSDRGVPTILLDRDGGRRRVCSVTVDDVRGGELAAGHLLDLGHQVIAFVNGPASIRQCADRREGARRAVQGARSRSARLSEVPVPALTVEHGQAAVVALMAQKPAPTAVMCANDLLALGVLKGLAAAGVDVPGKMAVVGYDDVTFASMLSPSLTSVRQPKFELGATAAQLLLEEAHEDGAHRHRRIRFEPELVVRASSGPVRA
jgi:LacI family transcriptional regulator, galactose operon repressor